jgi:putative FmdB family regulatory protein
MPLYEFICEDCGEIFEVLVLFPNGTQDVTCPSCQSDLVRKLISYFSTKISVSGSSISNFRSAASCNSQST